MVQAFDKIRGYIIEIMPLRGTDDCQTPGLYQCVRLKASWNLAGARERVLAPLLKHSPVSQAGTTKCSYLIGEKLFTFVESSEQDAEFAAELPAFVAAIRRFFTAVEIREYLHQLERTKYLAPRLLNMPGFPSNCYLDPK